MLLKVLGFILVHLHIIVYERFMNSMYDKIDENKQQASLKARKLEAHEKIRFIFRNLILVAILCYDILMMLPYITSQDKQADLFFKLLFFSSFIISAFLGTQLIYVVFELMTKLSDLISNNLFSKSYENFLVDYINKKDSKEQKEDKVVNASNNSSLL